MIEARSECSKGGGGHAVAGILRRQDRPQTLKPTWSTRDARPAPCAHGLRYLLVVTSLENLMFVAMLLTKSLLHAVNIEILIEPGCALDT